MLLTDLLPCSQSAYLLYTAQAHLPREWHCLQWAWPSFLNKQPKDSIKNKTSKPTKQSTIPQKKNRHQKHQAVTNYNTVEFITTYPGVADIPSIILLEKPDFSLFQ